MQAAAAMTRAMRDECVTYDSECVTVVYDRPARLAWQRKTARCGYTVARVWRCRSNEAKQQVQCAV